MVLSTGLRVGQKKQLSTMMAPIVFLTRRIVFLIIVNRENCLSNPLVYVFFIAEIYYTCKTQTGKPIKISKMKNLKTIEELRELVNSENYYFQGNELDTFFDLQKASEEHFKQITEDQDDQEKYYQHFGLNVGEAHINKVKVENYFVDEVNTTVAVCFYESYIDSGVSNEDYFHAYLIRY